MRSDAPNGYSIRGTGISGPGNGLPEPRYKYRGSGEDQLTPSGVMTAWNKRLRAMGASPGATSRGALERLAEAERALARVTVMPPPATRPSRPQAARRPAPAPEALPPAPEAGRLRELTADLQARGVLAPGEALPVQEGPPWRPRPKPRPRKAPPAGAA